MHKKLLEVHAWIWVPATKTFSFVALDPHPCFKALVWAFRHVQMTGPFSIFWNVHVLKFGHRGIVSCAFLVPVFVKMNLYVTIPRCRLRLFSLWMPCHSTLVFHVFQVLRVLVCKILGTLQGLLNCSVEPFWTSTQKRPSVLAIRLGSGDHADHHWGVCLCLCVCVCVCVCVWMTTTR